jgi:hypothetical protein
MPAKGEQGVEKLDRDRAAYRDVARRRPNSICHRRSSTPEMVRSQAMGTLQTRSRWAEKITRANGLCASLQSPPAISRLGTITCHSDEDALWLVLLDRLLVSSRLNPDGCRRWLRKSSLGPLARLVDALRPNGRMSVAWQRWRKRRMAPVGAGGCMVRKGVDAAGGPHTDGHAERQRLVETVNGLFKPN